MNILNKNIKRSSKEKKYFWESSLIDNRQKKTFILPKNREAIKQNLDSKNEMFSRLQGLFMTKEISTSISTNFVKSPDNLDKEVSMIDEEKSSTEHSSRNFFKPCIEMYMEKDRNDYVIHTYARPKRLVSIKTEKNTKINKGKKFISPNLRIGISGWKLSKPNTAKSEFSYKNVGKYRRVFLQITPKKVH